MNERITKFKVESPVSIWKFLGKKAYGDFGLSISGTRVTLISLLDLMDNSEWSSKKRFKTIRPDQDWILKTGAIETYDEIEIVSYKETEELFEIVPNSKVIHLMFGRSTLRKFRQMISADAFDIGMTDTHGKTLMFW